MTKFFSVSFISEAEAERDLEQTATEMSGMRATVSEHSSELGCLPSQAMIAFRVAEKKSAV
jgi:hypothetical protein